MTDSLEKSVKEFLWGPWIETRTEFEEVEALKKFIAAARLDEARKCAELVCHLCAYPEGYGPAIKINGTYWHRTILCAASAIHERLHRTQEPHS